MTGLSLAAEFPAATRADWMKRVEAVLKGASYDEKLVKTTAEGIRLEPLYGQIAGPRAAREHQTPWTLCQRVDHPDAAKANEQVLEDLANGATGLVLVARDSATARRFGFDTSHLRSVLQGIHLHAVALRVEGGGAIALADLIAGQPIDPERMNVSFAARDAAQASELADRGFHGPYVQADGRPWHERGASDAEELGATLSEAVTWLRALDDLNDVHLARAVGVTLAAHQDMFTTLAKFRAMRLLWKRVLDSSGLPDRALNLHGETSWRMLAALDPHTNILRATAAVFGAGLGGANSITVLPHSLVQGLPNPFARRIARNVQSVLLEESNLWRVADPASGAGYVETLTQALCARAWEVFQKMEAGSPPLPDSNAARCLPVIGTSAYRLPKEYPADVEVLS